MGNEGSERLGAGSACEMKPDACEAVPEAQACEAWLRRLDDAEFKATYAREEDRVDEKGEEAGAGAGGERVLLHDAASKPNSASSP